MYELWQGNEILPAVEFVGGAPVMIAGSASGYGQQPPAPPVDWAFEPIVFVNGVNGSDFSGILNNLKNYIGVAYHSRKVCNLIKKVTVIRAPAVITIFKGKATMKEFQQAEEFFPFGFTEDDPYTPFDADRTFAQGDLIFPIAKTIGGVTYSVWTNDLSLLGTGEFILPARVLSVSGGTGEDQVLTIELGAFFVKLAAA